MINSKKNKDLYKILPKQKIKLTNYPLPYMGIRAVELWEKAIEEWMDHKIKGDKK